jgi:hypothetical protein
VYTIGIYLEKGGVAVMIGAGVKDRVGRYFRQYYRCGSVTFPTLSNTIQHLVSSIMR